MKKKFGVLMVFMVILFLGNPLPATALESLGKLTSTDDSVTKVMQKAGCNFSWLSQVLADSGIDHLNLRRLPIGQGVFIQDGLCKTGAPAHVRSLSQLILSVDSGDLSPSSLGESQTEIVSLRGSLNKVTEEYNRTLSENTELKKQNIELENKLKATQVTPGSPRLSLTNFTTGRGGLVLIIPFLLGILSGMALLYFTVIQQMKKNVSFPSDWVIKEGGADYHFKLVGAGEASVDGVIVGKYACPLCTERNLYGREFNLRQHLVKKHLDDKAVGFEKTTISPQTS